MAATATKERAKCKYKGQAPHEPSKTIRETVLNLTGMGFTEREVSLIVGFSRDTLHKYYRTELTTGRAKADAMVAGALWDLAVNKRNVVALIYWTKARMGWTDRPKVEYVDPDKQASQIIDVDPVRIDDPDFDNLSPEELVRQYRATLPYIGPSPAPAAKGD